MRFEHRGKIYTVIRRPEYNRPKKRGEGFTRQPAEAELLLPDAPPVTKMFEVTRRVTEILRFNYKQFKQLCMLAQGSSSAFFWQEATNGRISSGESSSLASTGNSSPN